MNKILHIITGLNYGGAEIMLYRLLTQKSNNEYSHSVISLSSEGIVGAKMREVGIEVESLEITPGQLHPKYLLRLLSMIKNKNPDIIHTWLYHAALFGGVAAFLLGRKIPVVWAIHNTNLDANSIKAGTRLTAKICAKMSNILPAQIIYVADESREVHERFG